MAGARQKLTDAQDGRRAGRRRGGPVTATVAGFGVGVGVTLKGVLALRGVPLISFPEASLTLVAAVIGHIIGDPDKIAVGAIRLRCMLEYVEDARRPGTAISDWLCQ